jgi:TetR/AcrR family fatty acid metabolism transcriptional regulator
VKSATSVPDSGATPYYEQALTDRSIAQEEKRRLILDAAVRVFARKGYHSCRVGDITEEAGVAHGLLYHYFSSKEEVLETVFRDTWTEVLDAFRAVEGGDEAPREQLSHVAAILLRSWRRNPDLVRVLVREIGRSPQVQSKVHELGQAFKAIERIVARGQQEGVFRTDLDPRLASWIFYGAIEEILTGWVLGQLPDGDDDVAAAERTVVEVLCDGILVS